MGDTRTTIMSINLGDEQVLPERIECIESLSTPFTISVDVIAPLEIDIHPHLGKPAKIRVVDEGTPMRFFHGLLTASEYLKESTTGHHYRLTLRPWTYFLAQNRDFAIYQEKDAVTIIKEVLAEAKISDADFSNLKKTRMKRTYTVQYGESDFAFISRLMEEEGIYYYFKHTNDKHVMMLCEAPNNHAPGTPAMLRYNPSGASIVSSDLGFRDADMLEKWIERVSTTAESKVTTRDWDYKTPTRALQAQAAGETQHLKDEQEVYAYPGRYVQDTTTKVSHGGELSKAQLDGFRANRRTFTGVSQSPGLLCGNKVKIKGHPVDRMNADFLIVSTYHRIINETYRTGAEAEDRAVDVEFEAIPAATQYHPPQTTPKPVVHGIDSAIVTGPENEQIYVDEHCRVKVRFHWDRHGAAGEKTTCWIRVSQKGGLGEQIIPRVGHEVLVDFMSGDPDRPMIVGRVFNTDHMPIYALPEHKTRALWRTKSYPKPSGAYSETQELGDVKRTGANELRFEDKSGHEEIFIQAERDMNERVHYNHSHKIGHDQDEFIGHNRNSLIHNDEKTEVKQFQTHIVGKSQKNDIGEMRFTKIGQSDEVKIGTDRKLKADQSINYEAGQSIEIKVGQSSIKIDNMGITVKAGMIKIEGTQMVDVKGLMTTVKGSAMLTLKGGMTFIN